MINRTKIIIISGVPGTGKSTIAINLAQTLHYDQLISTDIIREVLKSKSRQKCQPILFSTTHEAWQFFGNYSSTNVIKGYRYHSSLLFKTLNKLIKNNIKNGCHTILEGSHLLPEFLDYLNKLNADIYYFLLSPPSYKELERRFENKNKIRTKEYLMWKRNIKTIKTINGWLKKEVKKTNLHLIVNKKINNTVSQILKVINNNEN